MSSGVWPGPLPPHCGLGLVPGGPGCSCVGVLEGGHSGAVRQVWEVGVGKGTLQDGGGRAHERPSRHGLWTLSQAILLWPRAGVPWRAVNWGGGAQFWPFHGLPLHWSRRCPCGPEVPGQGRACSPQHCPSEHLQTHSKSLVTVTAAALSSKAPACPRPGHRQCPCACPQAGSCVLQSWVTDLVLRSPTHPVQLSAASQAQQGLGMCPP